MQVVNQHDGHGEASFFLYTIEELDAKLHDCQMTVYGEAFYQHLLSHPRRTKDLLQAKFAFIPPYMAWEVHWPTYWPMEENLAKLGNSCYAQTVVEAKALVNDNSALPASFFAVLVDLDPYWFHELDPALHADPALSWAKVNTLDKYFRPGRDVSLPPPATELLARYKLGIRDTQHIKYLVTFKGSFDTSPLREKLAELHNPEAGVVIVNSKADESEQYGYEELMSSSNFTLVVRGHREYSYRFTEAVCSGAVPVLVADGWVPPFDAVVNFREYGVSLKEENYLDLITILRNIDDARVIEMKQTAMAFCHNHLVSVHHQWDTLTELLLSNHIQ